MNEIKILKENAIVVQSNELVEANYKLSPSEQKLVLALASQIDTRKENFELVKVNAKSLSQVCKFTSKDNYAQLQKIIKKILNRSLIIKRRDGSGWYGTHWVQSCNYVSARQNNNIDTSYVEVEFDKLLCPHLLQLKNRFLQANISQLVSFKHTYSIRFYMIFRNLVNNLPKCTKKYTFKEIVTLLDLPKTYIKSTVNLKSKVIKNSINDINEKSDIAVEYKYYSEGGRAHVGVIFTFWLKPKKEITPPDVTEQEPLQLTSSSAVTTETDKTETEIDLAALFASIEDMDMDEDELNAFLEAPATAEIAEQTDHSAGLALLKSIGINPPTSSAIAEKKEEPAPALAVAETKIAPTKPTEKNKNQNIGGVGERLNPELTEEQQTDYDNLLKIEVWAEAAKKIITTYDHARIERNYIGVMQDQKKGTIANLPAVVRKAIENDNYKGVAEEKRKLFEREQASKKAKYEKAQQAEAEKEAQRAKEQTELKEMEKIRGKYTPEELNRVMAELKPIYQQQNNVMSDDIINHLKQYGITHNKFIRYTKNMFSFK